MTEEQIIAMGLSDKRERALIAVFTHYRASKMFWLLVFARRWGLAAQELLETYPVKGRRQFLADAIWEG